MLRYARDSTVPIPAGDVASWVSGDVEYLESAIFLATLLIYDTSKYPARIEDLLRD